MNSLTASRQFAIAVLLTLSISIMLRPVHASDPIETAGDILQLALPAAAGTFSVAQQDWNGVLQLGESSALTLGTTYALKYTIHETRPNGGNQSFPSAHSSISFAAAEYARKRYGWEFGVPMYGLASFVAYSRVESDNHWPHDVIAGAAIGIASSYIFTRRYHGWDVQVEADTRHWGLRLTRNF